MTQMFFLTIMALYNFEQNKSKIELFVGQYSANIQKLQVNSILEELNNGVVIVSNLFNNDAKTTPSFEYSNNTITNVFKKVMKDYTS